MEQCIVRAAGKDDLPQLEQLDWHVAPRVLAHAVEEGRILILEERGHFRGWLRWSLFWDEAPFLNMLFLLEEHRGRALGTFLLDVWEQAMAETGHRRILTSTRADERSQHFYRRRGYLDSGVLLLPGEVAELLLLKDLED